MLDVLDSGGECWRCGGTGMSTDPVSEAEARHTLGDFLPKGAKFIYGHFASLCECAKGRELAKLMRSNPNENS